jgi:hypothetical protein
VLFPRGNWSLQPVAIGAGGGDKALEAFETTGRVGGSAIREAATRVNAVQAPLGDVEADPVCYTGKATVWETERG